MNSEFCIVGVEGTMGQAFQRRGEAVGVTLYGVGKKTESYMERVADSDVVLLSMKQADLLAWLNWHGTELRENQIVLSLAAMLSLDKLEAYCSNDAVRIGRVMTTTGVATGTEQIVWSSDGRFSQDQISSVQELLSRFGETSYLGERNEREIDKRTYRACVVGFMADACSAHISGLIQSHLGFTREQADEAVDNALRVVLAQRQEGISYEHVRDRVMSKGGLTEAGVMGRYDRFYASVIDGMFAAMERAKQIADRPMKKGA